jgi:isomerase DpgB
LWLVVNNIRSLPELTEELNSVCALAEQGDTSIVISAGAVSPEGRAWPGVVRIAEISRWERAVRRLERLACPTIALASGMCGGPSLDLMLASDYRIVARNLRLLLPVNDGQFWPGMVVHRLVTQMGVARARRIVLWGSELTAEQAVAIGLADELTTDISTSVSAARVLLTRQNGAELAVRRQLLQEASSSAYEAALGVHLAACDRELRRLARRAGDGEPAHGRPPTAAEECS